MVMVHPHPGVKGLREEETEHAGKGENSKGPKGFEV